MKFLKRDNPAGYLMREFPNHWSHPYVTNQQVYTLPDTDTKIWYENRDGYHAGFQGSPDIIENSEGQTGWAISYNEAYKNGIVVANSSTAHQTSEDYGSNTRAPDNYTVFWHTIRESWEMGLLQHFPEHQDYDNMDWFKINQPYIVTTQGSSGSEGNEVGRTFKIVYSLRPEVREWLIQNKRVGDVVSYLLRSNLFGGYLDPLCHRVCCDTPRHYNQADIDLAHSITLDTIPPRIKISVISDSLGHIRDEYNQASTYTVRTNELAGFARHDQTPTRTIEVEISGDKPNLDLHWIKSQGECDIVFQNPQKTRATITIPLQSDFDVMKQNGETIFSNRVEVVIVAHDGTHYSSPVFVTEYMKPASRVSKPRANEIRVAADNAFICRVDGTEIMRGSNWSYFPRKSLPSGARVVEIDVTNTGGPGGMLCEIWEGDKYISSDETWTAMYQGQVVPISYVISHPSGPWSNIYGVYGAPKWLWCDVPEDATVTFRKVLRKQRQKTIRRQRKNTQG